MSKIHRYNVRVYYEDVDLGGIVYHSMYLNYCERARSEIFFAAGQSPVQGDIHFVVRHIEADFIGSGRFSEELQVRTQMTEQKKASFTLRQEVFIKDSDQKLFAMDVRLACLKGERVNAIPEGFLALFE